MAKQTKDKPIKVPDSLHRQAKSAAAAQGMTLKQWISNLIKAALGIR